MTQIEWKLFNDFRLEIYYSDDIKTFGTKCLKLLKLFIPYAQGYFIITDGTGRVDVEKSVFEDVSHEKQIEYIEHYYDVDYLKLLYPFSKTVCYRDTDIISNDNRKNSEMYLKFIKPQKLDMGCGIIVTQEGEVKALINLLRIEGDSNISDYEMSILDTFRPHLEKNILHYYERSKSSCIEDDYLDKKKIFHLSGREVEIAKLISEGYSNNEIGETFNISPSTVKKHISNIFKKTGVNRRIQLINRIEQKQY